MSSLEWIAVGVGPIGLLIALYLLVLRRVPHDRHSLLTKVDQLGHRLHEQLSEQQSEPSQEQSHVTKQILEALRESEEQPGSVESSVLSAVLSSINPVQESIVNLSHRLSKLEAEQPAHNEAQSLNLASLAVIYIRSHVYDVIRVELMAKELCVSTSTLYSYLKECLGCSAHELVTVIKMQEAKRLLATDDLLVKQVAARLGFWSPYHFSSRFKAFFGLSPNQLKEHYQKRKQNQVVKTAAENCLKITKTICKQDDLAQQQVEQDAQKKSRQKKKTKELPSGTEIGRFLIVNSIAHGGMGVVYKAYDPKLNRGVALKLIRAEHPIGRAL